MQLTIVESTRIDKYLWACRFYKTRSVAADEIGKSRIKINGAVVKASREVKVNDQVEMLRSGLITVIDVLQVSDQRGPAPLAQTLYRETEASIAAREKAAEIRRFTKEPAMALPQGRPTKRDRRALDEAKRSAPGWNDRWSAEI
jgi:ribosome-associated heat shock protein Hsp15